MFYINSVFRRASYKKGAFSLVEVLMALLIISIVIIVAAPAITKKAGAGGKYGEIRHEGIVYTYNGNNIEQDSSTKCLIYTESGSSGKYEPTNECSEYEFNVPEGVTSVNLTLVAGGGGGGGASGGLLVQNKVSGVSGTTYFNKSLNVSKLKSFKIIHLVGKGKDGDNFEAMEDKDDIGNTKRNIYRIETYNTTAGKQQVQIGTATGGKSSFALHDYTLPESLYRPTYRNVLENNITKTFKAIGQVDSTLSSQFAIDSNFIITVNPDGLTCDKNGKDCTSTIPHQNIIDAVGGTRRNFFFDARIGIPYRHGKNYGYLEGGAGGYLPYYSKYGAGGRGQALICQKTDPKIKGLDCNKNNADTTQCLKITDSYAYTNNLSGMDDEIKTNMANNPLYCYVPCQDSSCGTRELAQLGTGGAFSAIYIEETAGNPGTGGAGGGVIRIKNFPVNSKYTYVVRVGKGGKKGIGGKYNYGSGLAGENGYSGVSSSIWQKNGNTETLLYLVTGGVGGAGGSATSAANSGIIANAKRNTSVVLTNSSNKTSEIQDLLGLIDKEKTEIYSETCSVDVTNTLSGITEKCAHYPILDYKKGTNISFEKPYSYLSYLDSEKTNTIKTMGGFSSFDSNINPKKVTINSKDYLTSFYYKTIVDNKIGYVGGLGGFSGLGTKAGCGGLFMGNANGFNGNTTNPRYNADGAKKMYIQKELTSSNYDMYDIKDYYDNCSGQTPNGQSAEFILPNPEKQYLGQAGSGGGGGGYLMFKGAGDGGDGQNGYVMIDWRK